MHLLKSQRGVTLVELMIAVFTGGLLLVMAMGTLLNISGTSTNFTQSLDTEIEELSAANALQLVFGQASELKYHGNSSMNSYSNAAGIGHIRDYDSNNDFGTFPPVSTLAVFMRDRQPSVLTAPSTLASNLLPTAIYFQAPTPTTWGVLYLSLGDQPLAPTFSGSHFDGLVRARVLNINTYSPLTTSPTIGDPVTSFDVELTFRRFIGDMKPNARMFCPAASMAACPGIGAYKDVARIFKISLRNNVLAVSPNSDPATPKGGRMYDLIHFFVLGRAAEMR